MSCFGLIRWRKERGDDVDDTEKGLEEAFFRRLTNEKVVYLWNDVYVYGNPFIEKMEDYSKTIDICSREFFPSIESIALPTEVSIDIARKTHLMQTMPNVLLYPMSAEDNLSSVKDVISEKASEGDYQSWRLSPQGSILKHSACLPIYALLQDTRLEGGKAFLVEGLCFRREREDDRLAFHLREFHMKEIVFVGSEDFCQKSQRKAEVIWNRIEKKIGLACVCAPASDSFCPSYEEMLSGFQTMTSSKKEYRFPLLRGTRFLTCGSSNMHRIAFSKPFNIRMRSGVLACSSCLAFGLERLCFTDYLNSMTSEVN